MGEYLLAVYALAGKPPIDDFMLLADDDDLNPTMIVRYQAYLEQTRRGHDPVWAIWHALAELPPSEFAAEAPAVVERLIARPTPSGRSIRWWPAAFLGKPLKEPADAARIYGELLAGADKPGRRCSRTPASRGAEPPRRLADANLEALRQVLYGPDAPANVTLADIGVLDLLPDRPAQMERTKLLKAIEDWRAKGPAAPPRAMVLDELPKPVRAARLRARQSEPAGRSRAAALSPRAGRRSSRRPSNQGERPAGTWPGRSPTQQPANAPACW